MSDLELLFKKNSTGVPRFEIVSNLQGCQGPLHHVSAWPSLQRRPFALPGFQKAHKQQKLLKASFHQPSYYDGMIHSCLLYKVLVVKTMGHGSLTISNKPTQGHNIFRTRSISHGWAAPSYSTRLAGLWTHVRKEEDHSIVWLQVLSLLLP